MSLEDEDVTFVTAEGHKYVGQRWPSDPGDDTPVVGTLFYSSGARYQGEMMRGAPHGYGTMTAVGATKTGGTVVYDGEHLKGLRNGFGRLRRFRVGISSPLVYLFEGHYRDDVPHGSGTETIWANPLALNAAAAGTAAAADGAAGVCDSSGSARLEYRYTGTFRSGERHGHGLLEDFVKHRVIEGAFSGGEPDGHVIIKWLRSSDVLRQYVGDVRRGLLHGQGTLIASSGEVFRGEFRDNRKLRGVLTDADGHSNARRAVYDAETGALLEFEDISSGAHGHAAATTREAIAAVASSASPDQAAAAAAAASTSEQDDEVTAQFRRGQNDVEATIVYPNGDTFRGECIAGAPHGRGRTEFANGAGFHEGLYAGGTFEGPGTMIQQKLASAPPPLFALGAEEGEKTAAAAEPNTSNSSDGSGLRSRTWRYVGNFRGGLFHGKGQWWGALRGLEFDRPDQDAPVDASAVVAMNDTTATAKRRDFFDGTFAQGEMATGRYYYRSVESRRQLNLISDGVPDESDAEDADASSVPYYEGEHLHSRPHGRGALFRPRQGVIIRGIFFHGVCCDTHATIEYRDAHGQTCGVYSGGVLHNKRHGTGVHTIYDPASGSVVVERYEGEHHAGLRHGVGILETRETTVEGLFRRGVPASHCTVRKHDDGTAFAGSVLDDGRVAGVIVAPSGLEAGVVQ